MLSPTAFLRLPYDESLTRAGIAYAQKSLHYTYNRMHQNTPARLRKIVAGVAAELALRRWLDAAEIPYDVLGATAFTARDKYDLRLAGRRCDLKTYFLNNKTQIQKARDPQWLLATDALVPEDQLQGDALGEQDYYLFGFLLGLETRQQDDVRRALAARRPTYFLQTFNDPAWHGQPHWQPLGPLVFKSDCDQPLPLEIGGQTIDHATVTETLVLPPRQRVTCPLPLASVLYLHSPHWPTGRLGVHSPTLKQTVIIAPDQWCNIWVYGLEIILTGYLTKSAFRAQSRKLPVGAPVQQYAHTQTPNRAVPMQALRPLAELFALAKAGR